MTDRLELPDHAERIGAAHRLMQWEHGDDERADAIIAAYLDPDSAHDYLDREGAPE